MAETEKEYQLRLLCSTIIEWLENSTNDLDNLCDCGTYENEGSHDTLCNTSLMRMDLEKFKQRMDKIRLS